MPRFNSIFNFVLIAAFSLVHAVAGSPEQAEKKFVEIPGIKGTNKTGDATDETVVETVVIDSKTEASAMEATVGRFVMTPCRESLVLLDTATGNTWILKAGGDTESLSWTPIHRDTDRTLEMLDVAEAATDGRIKTQRVPELGVIILRGSREDVQTARKAIQKKEDGGRAEQRK